MTFLSQLFINKTDAARRRISDSYAWHQVIWKSFMNCDGKPRSFLFRIDDAGTRFRLLLLSKTKPSSDNFGNWQIKTVSPDFLGHQCYRFQIKANPTMRRASDRRRIGIYSENKLREWIEKKAEKNGFKIEPNSLIIGTPMDEVFVRNRTRGKHVSVDFQGALNVFDLEVFRTAFEKGIGSAKSFGYGMLMLQPTNTEH
ncbi:type I-E CRISPR-associated protein Cas6/Cse3/CasE [Desulfobacter latus]|uniref:Type I-E CRISPR-associated protein Cas6/Cse3/CasE n=1 Tax=Desulfobacter latus TaxID=2292 RepID=A0A850T4Y8_9BACT|nr:type I-E CRISPR-associated protein Cas6/Cse3/CasE [Desulfobacter latus]NWH06833.1 type I-E CRISPR-associated protein Cas6/Cse3/CasE [Desulfobacter latus]